MTSVKRKNQIILNKAKLGFFYKVMMTLNGIIAGFFVVIMIYTVVNPSDWGFALVGIPVEIYVVWPLSILNVIYFSYVLFNKTVTKVQKILAIIILVFSAIIMLIGLSSFGILPGFTSGD
jgi:hypothetical protein